MPRLDFDPTQVGPFVWPETPLAKRLAQEDEIRARELAALLPAFRGRKKRDPDVIDKVLSALRQGARSHHAVAHRSGLEKRSARNAINLAIRKGLVLRDGPRMAARLRLA